MWNLGSKRNRERGQFEMKEAKEILGLDFEFAGRERSSIESRRYGFCVIRAAPRQVLSFYLFYFIF